MHNVKYGVIPSTFKNSFIPVNHLYRTRYSINNFQIPNLSSAKLSIKVRGPTLWNNYLNEYEKTIVSLIYFKKIIKAKLLTNTDELKYF